VVGTTIVVGTETKQVIYVKQGKRVDVAGPITSLTASRDGRTIAAQLANGATVLLDAEGNVRRQLEPADANQVSEALDATGALILRARRGTPTIWDTVTGDLLLYELEVFRYAVTARFAKDGKIEIAGSEIGTIEIAPDQRPIAAILRDIDCRVPLQVAGTRLKPRAVTCR
jgi:hypothetical protein